MHGEKQRLQRGGSNHIIQTLTKRTCSRRKQNEPHIHAEKAELTEIVELKQESSF